MEVGVELEKKRKSDVKAYEELDRVNWIKTRELEKSFKDMQEDLSVIKEEKKELKRAVKRGEERLVDLRDYGDGWKKKYTDHKETTEQKMEDQMRQLESEIKDKVKKIREVEKNDTLLVNRSLILEDKLK